MIQVDTLLSYGMSSALAVAAARRSSTRQATGEFSPLALTVLWVAVTFVPQPMYLLWAFPAWETMFLWHDHQQVPAWVVAAVPAAMTALAAAGFVITTALLKRGQRRLAIGQMWVSLLLALEMVTLGWDGTGYQRFLSPNATGTFDASPSVSAFLASDVNHAISALIPLMLVPYALLMWRWFRSPRTASSGLASTAQPQGIGAPS